MSKIDMLNKKFGRLLIIQEAPKPEGSKCREKFWLCQCDCGNQIISRGSNLRNGNTKSCGCLQKEIASNIHFKDLSGMIFGKLTVIEPINRMQNEKHIKYKCRCECGNECEVLGINLTKGFTKSCGCNWRNSYGAQKIKELLDKNVLSYSVEVKQNINNKNYYWDFVTFEGWIIEYDGEQHFHSGSESGWNNKENFNKTKQRDKIKNNYAIDNNLILIRIPYTHTEITYRDLNPITSSFLINKNNIKQYYINNGMSEEDYKE